MLEMNEMSMFMTLMVIGFLLATLLMIPVIILLGNLRI